MFIIYDKTTKQIFSVSEVYEPCIPDNHDTFELDMSFSDLKTHPSFCRFIDGRLEYSPELESAFDYDYTIKRASKYPSITDQLDMLWHMMDDEIIPGKDSLWYNTILSIKEKYPKSE